MFETLRVVWQAHVRLEAIVIPCPPSDCVSTESKPRERLFDTRDEPLPVNSPEP